VRILMLPVLKSAISNAIHRYRYQFEAFVDKLRGRTPKHWYDGEDSIANMEWIARVYEHVSGPILNCVKTTLIKNANSVLWECDQHPRLRSRRPPS
jgi:hypothetical protein